MTPEIAGGIVLVLAAAANAIGRWSKQRGDSAALERIEAKLDNVLDWQGVHEADHRRASAGQRGGVPVADTRVPRPLRAPRARPA